MSEFRIDDYLTGRTKTGSTDKLSPEAESRFRDVCDVVRAAFDAEWEVADEEFKSQKLEREKKAIIGYEKETTYYKDRIKAILTEKNLLGEQYPSYYPNIHEAIFAELYGFAGLAPWVYDMTPEYAESSSAKIIGDRIYCLINGKSELQPQRINDRRREQLKRALLLASPKERLEDGFHEVYLHNGIRITIFSGERTKPGQDIIVFRKYVLKDLTFEKMVQLGTIPPEAVDIFKAMIKIGYNVVFAGQVRSGKTTFLQTWQRYESSELEGLAIATDPETRWDLLMPDAPIMQLVVDDKELEGITKSLLRGDQDYVLLEEMRDAAAFNIFLDITSTGTQRSKGTIHDNNAINIPYKMASKIRAKYGGDESAIIAQCYSNINYVIEFYQVPENKALKRMKGITEFRYDPEKDIVSAHRICQYNALTDKWYWKCDIGKDKEALAIGYEDELITIKKRLKQLETLLPMEGNSVIYPAYYKSNMIKE